MIFVRNRQYKDKQTLSLTHTLIQSHSTMFTFVIGILCHLWSDKSEITFIRQNSTRFEPSINAWTTHLVITFYNSKENRISQAALDFAHRELHVSEIWWKMAA